MKSILRLALVGTSCLLFLSCSAMHSLTDKTTSFLMPSKLSVVKARPKDWKELPLGRERALAFQDSKKSGGGGFFGFFRGPVDFKEPMLPKTTGVADGSLLPPRAN